MRSNRPIEASESAQSEAALTLQLAAYSFHQAGILHSSHALKYSFEFVRISQKLNRFVSRSRTGPDGFGPGTMPGVRHHDAKSEY